MRYALALLAILCGVLMALAFSAPPRHKLVLRGKQDGKFTQITVIMPQMDVTYRWLSVYVCAAIVDESGSYCSGLYERESTMELDGRKQAYVEWQNLPAGAVLIQAMAFDAESQIKASDTLAMFLR